MDSESKYRLTDKLFEKLSSLLFYFFLFVFIVALAFPHNPAGNWYQQFMPNLNGRQITDIVFIDSLTGYCTTSPVSDTSYILKTTNSGDNWVILYDTNGFIMNSIHFFNQNTGYVGGTHLIKTTDGGNTWSLSTASLFLEDFHFISIDTGWFVKSNSLTGGVFFTSNGGASWQNQLFLGNQNPSKIYMYNARIGFVSSTAGLYKTTNGSSWFNASNDFSFSDMFFIDSLTGWKASGFMKKTTDGGLNWINQPLPTGNFLGQGVVNIMNVNNDTIWASGESIIIPGGSPPFRGILYRTINGGSNWLFQVPDTSIHIANYFLGQFINLRHGWAYQFIQGGIHTTNGGDTTFYVPINQISSEIPKEFKLEQNYPNPFNPKSNIKYQISKNSVNIKIIVFDITGKEIAVLVNEKHTAGTYQTEWNASGYSSGVYFYSLIIDGITVDTKKMILLK
jgi:photosystem II stability/assembly factor-like uncharacterized protein